jgi:hypothetical protein
VAADVQMERNRGLSASEVLLIIVIIHVMHNVDQVVGVS